MSTDYDKIRADAEAEVSAELAQVKDPRERRAVAEEIRDQAYMELSMLKEERQQLIASAALYEYTPGMYKDFGIAPTHLRRLVVGFLRGGLNSDQQANPPSWPAYRAHAARAAGIPHPKNVRKLAEEIAARYEGAEARRNAAITQLESAEEMLRTAGGRVRVAALDRPDFDAVRAKARQEVEEEFAELDATDEARLRRAAEVVDDAEEKVAELLPKRDAAMCSLAFYTTARGIYYSAGINRTAANRVMARLLKVPSIADIPKRDKQPAAARAAGVRFVNNAERKLPQIALEYEAAKARQAAATKVRNELIPVMAAAPHNWPVDRIAEAIDRDPKIVRRILSPETNPIIY
ncbi:hypothetical protein ACFUC2_04880 [[Kitasatospora] papulosa]|uniref:hypothetical protein n=1 Tax=[Kitasatospora] papulosa TaxID=1464011 RepID=UPI00363B4A34